MPTFFQNKCCVELSEIVPDYMSVHSFKHFQVRKKTISVLRKGCKNTSALYEYASFPGEVKKLYEAVNGNPERKAQKSYFEMQMETDPKAIAFFQSFQMEDGRYLPDAVRIEYIRNAEVLNTTSKVLRDRILFQRALNNVKKGNKADLIKWVISHKDVLSHTLPENPDRFAKKLNEYLKVGYASLISGKWQNQNRRIVDDATIKMLNALFQQQEKPTYTEAARQYEAFSSGYIEVISKETGEIFDPKDFRKVSSHTVKHYLAQWGNKAPNESARSGDHTAFGNKYRTSHSFERPKFSGSIISVDDRQPPFKTLGKTRPWFYLGIDLHSEAYVSWVYGRFEDKNSEFLLAFYRQLVINCVAWGLGIPYEVECESSLNSLYKDTLLAPGSLFSSVRIHQNAPNSKRIERYFRELRYGFDKKRLGFIARPFAKAEANQKGSEKEPLLNYSDIISNCLTDIQTWNNLPHSIYKTRTRWEVWLEDQATELAPPNWRVLLPYLGHKVETSVRNGQVRLQGGDWLLGDEAGIATGEKLISIFKNAADKEVFAYYLDDNEGNMLSAIITDKQGRYLSYLHEKPKYQRATLEQTPADFEKRELMTRYEQTLYGFLKREKNKVESVVTIQNKPRTLNDKFKIKELGGVSVAAAATGARKEREVIELPPILDDNNYEEIVLVERTSSRVRTLSERI